MRRLSILLLACVLAGTGLAGAAETAPSKPAAAPAKAAKPSARGPGTQTEDELYIGAKARTPQKAKAKPSARETSSDEDLEDLEVQRNRPKAR